MIVFMSEPEIAGFEQAIKSMRNAYSSWKKMDSYDCDCFDTCEECPHQSHCDDSMPGGRMILGPSDYKLANSLALASGPHAKFRRMINVYVDILAPLYWWKEFDTYKIGTVVNSTSTMHTLHKRDLTLKNFSTEHLRKAGVNALQSLIDVINIERRAFVGNDSDQTLKGDKQCWYSMIQMLPSSFMQLRTVMVNYETLSNIYISRHDHKLDEWKDFCKWVESLWYSELITLRE